MNVNKCSDLSDSKPKCRLGDRVLSVFTLALYNRLVSEYKRYQDYIKTSHYTSPKPLWNNIESMRKELNGAPHNITCVNCNWCFHIDSPMVPEWVKERFNHHHGFVCIQASNPPRALAGPAAVGLPWTLGLCIKLNLECNHSTVKYEGFQLF